MKGDLNACNQPNAFPTEGDLNVILWLDYEDKHQTLTPPRNNHCEKSSERIYRMKNVSSIASLRGFTKKIISSYLDKYFENNLHLFIYGKNRHLVEH